MQILHFITMAYIHCHSCRFFSRSARFLGCDTTATLFVPHRSNVHQIPFAAFLLGTLPILYLSLSLTGMENFITELNFFVESLGRKMLFPFLMGNVYDSPAERMLNGSGG